MKNIYGAGLGFRREMLKELLPSLPSEVDFWEVAPENWIPLGGKYQKQFQQASSQSPFTTHGLSLSIGSSDKLDVEFVKTIKRFLDANDIALYSEHLSFCSGNGHMYDLMPIPFTEDAIKHVVSRIAQVQDIIERPLVLENVSYYLAPGQEMDELEFTSSILNESGCQMLLDVNNVYVNSINHKYDAKAFIKGLPSDKIVYGHIAGHYDEAEDLKVDTHGADVIEPVWELLEYAYLTHGVFPTLLERDFNIPPLNELLAEVKRIKQIQARCEVAIASKVKGSVA
ncbi:HvfB family MNIO-type RiPP peptide maturase [Alteromonas abrolhosensis]|uniref:HvfB family MNIO-type RiPP peptide maturase n=1 Tax=Alteromonas abrolhosensis TaxID=1892904 RepID=UPI003515BB13